jgi:hypothetical protein
MSDHLRREPPMTLIISPFEFGSTKNPIMVENVCIGFNVKT